MKTTQDSKPCIECGASTPESYPHCTKCKIELLEWWVNPKSGAPFSDGSKDMMKSEVKELKALLAKKGQTK
jgi:hypothetical protein